MNDADDNHNVILMNKYPFIVSILDFSIQNEKFKNKIIIILSVICHCSIGPSDIEANRPRLEYGW